MEKWREKRMGQLMEENRMLQAEIEEFRLELGRLHMDHNRLSDRMMDVLDEVDYYKSLVQDGQE